MKNYDDEPYWGDTEDEPDWNDDGGKLVPLVPIAMENHWIDKEGTEHFIPDLGDHHLFSIMEALLKMTRMKRRLDIENLTGIVEMFSDSHMSYISEQVRQDTEHKLNEISSMNTDAYGESFIHHYVDIMTEAAARNMRDPFSPDYEKENA